MKRGNRSETPAPVLSTKADGPSRVGGGGLRPSGLWLDGPLWTHDHVFKFPAPQFLTTYRLFSVSKHTLIFMYWSSFRSSKVADTRESSPKRETSQVRREMPLNAGKPNRSSSNGLAVGNDKNHGNCGQGAVAGQSNLASRRGGQDDDGYLEAWMETLS